MSNEQPSNEEDSLLREAEKLTEYMYEKLADFPDEEKWYTATKLRSAAVDFIFFVSIAVGNTNPVGREFDWINARKFTTAVTTIYRFAGRQKFIELDPAIMVRLKALSKQIDAIVVKARKNSEHFRTEEAKKDLQPWLEKYNIYRQLNEGKKNE